MNGFRAFILATVLVACATSAGAVQPDEQLADPILERQAREISAGLRCPVCQNQSIDDSDAPLARDLRLLVRQRLQAGDSEAEVRNYLVARYGDFVLLRPAFRTGTMLLWLSPLLVLAVGGAVAITRLRQAPGTSDERLSPDEEQEIDRILGDRSSKPDAA